MNILYYEETLINENVQRLDDNSIGEAFNPPHRAGYCPKSCEGVSTKTENF